MKSLLWTSPDSRNSHHQQDEAIAVVIEQTNGLCGRREEILERRKALIGHPVPVIDVPFPCTCVHTSLAL